MFHIQGRKRGRRWFSAAALFLSLLFVAALLVSLVAAASHAQEARPQATSLGTEFTYQGQLQSNGTPYTGTCDLRFGLWDALSGGAQIGGTQTKTNVNLAEGYFTVQLDFGAGVFQGDARWLAIEVQCPTGTGGYTALSPRQPLTPTPYALALPGLWTQPNTTSPNIIGGYSGNAITAGVKGATIGGGGSSGAINRVTDMYSTVSGGANNQAGNNSGSEWDAKYSTVGGGDRNTASGEYATVGGGSTNTASRLDATVAGGSHNEAIGPRAAVGGGYGNQASGEWATVAGGQGNIASRDHATVGGGYNNTASNYDATVGGGTYNQATGVRATVGGGFWNAAFGDYATVAGGGAVNMDNADTANFATNAYCTVGGGGNNRAGNANNNPNDAIYATVSGGQGNRASYFYATVGGGSNNTASNEGTTIAGGYGNVATGFAGTVSGGNNNTAVDYWSTVGGGLSNTASGENGTVGGGAYNNAGDAATVGGGVTNTASGHVATVGGGAENAASNRAATVGGGENNNTGGHHATVAGGENNNAGGNHAAVGGGASNEARGVAATVGGGWLNTANGFTSTVPGGSGNKADGTGSFAAGHWAWANATGCFVWGDFTESDHVTCSQPNRTIFRSSGGFYIYTNAEMTEGMYLPAGGDQWEAFIPKAQRENSSPVNSQALLETLASLTVQEYNLKSQDSSIRHIGLLAEDFATLGYGESDTAINMQDANGVALAAIQALYAQNQELKAQNAVQQAQLDDLAARVAALETQSTHTSGLPFGWLALGGLIVVGGTVSGRRRLPGGRR